MLSSGSTPIPKRYAFLQHAGMFQNAKEVLASSISRENFLKHEGALEAYFRGYQKTRAVSFSDRLAVQFEYGGRGASGNHSGIHSQKIMQPHLQKYSSSALAPIVSSSGLHIRSMPM